MTGTDIGRVQTYLRRLFGTDRVRVVPPAKPGLSVEVAVDDEVIGTLHRDVEEGEISFSVHLTILDEDLPPPPRPSAAADRKRAR